MNNGRETSNEEKIEQPSSEKDFNGGEKDVKRIKRAGGKVL